MSTKTKTAITPTRAEDYPEWYQQVIKGADLAENSPVRGCMVIKPWGYALWENIQRVLDKKFKDTGHKNAYFPLFIPKSYLEKEAKHVEGFAKECAVITHSRLEVGPDGELVPASPLEEPLVVRPTSETIIGEMFSKWVQSHRDLPLLINQWANVVRWEMRTRMFLRTMEFLWQEGHTAHATKEEALQETRQMLDVYVEFCEQYLAMPVIKGEKTESERFPGADITFCIEALMQDKKALQAGTSHFLGQNFSKSANIRFLDQDSKEQYAWTTSWGMSTRVIGGMIMTHGDDNGIIMPPRLAPTHIVILPVLHKEETKAMVLEYVQALKQSLESICYFGRILEVEVDQRDIRGGDKRWQWVKKGVPIILEIGPRDIENDAMFMGRRDNDPSDRKSINRKDLLANVADILDEIQNTLLQRARDFVAANTVKIDNKEDFYAFFTPKNENKPEIHGGFAYAHWNGSAEVEEQIKKDLKVTIRCIPLEEDKEPGKCVITGEPSKQRVYFAKSY
ncbi:MAG: proline--tRNA ligase [Verrucomicrobia bacterium CG_4_10_14_3_um_filter_43_23]|nr:MAG: proline--tRNA ligase [Verrucomicrobia bacterium CG22_combo_CG10-13_8_21_14_all_43_17]PIX57749.1 MAG: proline--tRNA ligase [Verrucomicrobia bacterium CG_4_10_14_3_um_filter_43_23]PIY61085.1 MAG: proline--tRNA ligase [Verrucomicrobia bacterium CG_4_10_14_0_8_um_filter_43_34]PJA44217.1 MAG: proline--tRNA ligase [Verrucomicrobia bacterium CG_4_9_14_3_um_filter_43_20]